MGEINFYLKKAEPATKENPKPKQLIYLQFKYHGKKLVYTFGQKVHSNEWNSNKQRIKSNLSNHIKTSDGKHLLNDLLDNLTKVCEHAYNTEIKNGIPEPKTIKKHLIAFMNQNEGQEVNPDKPSLFKLIDRFINNEFSHRGKKLSADTIKQYRSFKKHLEAFQHETRSRVDFDAITLDFFYRYVAYLRDKKGHKINTLDKYIRQLKTVMNQAVALNYTENLAFKHRDFCIGREETCAVYLSDDELLTLFKCDLSNNKEMEQVRDLFVFGALTGLRFSDYVKTQRENIVNVGGELFIKIVTDKTNQSIIIPCHPIVLQIIEKYEMYPNGLPNDIPGNTKDSKAAMFNRIIKKVCRQAGLTAQGRFESDPEKELCDCVMSHTARRSFATNLYLQGFPTYDIMLMTGHTEERNFRKYVKVDKLAAAKRLSIHAQAQWREKISKAASLN